VAAGEATEGEFSGLPRTWRPSASGKGASIRSDIYALGLVLYELYTGRKAFEGASFQELKRKHSEEAPASPSTVSPGFDPVVERVILRCLEKDPGRRPFSVSQVAAALPGGDPLAAALAAGETPSPEVVAAAGEEGALSAGRGWALVGGVLAILLAILAFAPYATDLGQAPLPRTSEALEDRARELTQSSATATLPPTPRPAGIAVHACRYRADHLPSPARVRELAAAEPHPYWFEYRQSPRSMVPANGDARVRFLDPPLEISGMVNVTLDARGKLVRFLAVAPQIDESKGPWPDPDWEALFGEAGLLWKRFTPSVPKWLSPVPFDTRAEWDGTHLPSRSPDSRDRRLVPWQAGLFCGAPGRGSGHAHAGGSPGSRTDRLARNRCDRASFIAVLHARPGPAQYAPGPWRPPGSVSPGGLPVGPFHAGMASGGASRRGPRGEFDVRREALAFSLFFAAFVWLTNMALEPFSAAAGPIC
jgi:serine/threonine-protein kinase